MGNLATQIFSQCCLKFIFIAQRDTKHQFQFFFEVTAVLVKIEKNRKLSLNKNIANYRLNESSIGVDDIYAMYGDEPRFPC